MKCPRCSSQELHRSRLRWWDYLLLPLLLRPMRSAICDRRGYYFVVRVVILE